jgi:glycosyltransferase involved in cell wall biosynthesis
MNISVLINTFNEEKNIENCLKAVEWADEIIIVDMHSDDNTVEIASRYTDKIFYFKRMGYADPARQFALNHASNDWILVVDADEIVPLKLRNTVNEIAEKDLSDVVYIPRSNYFAGKKINSMGLGALQDIQPRFFKKGYLNFKDEIHDFFKLKDNARINSIDDTAVSFTHLSFLDFEQYVERMNRYTTIEATSIFNGKKERNYLLKSILLTVLRIFKEIILYKWYKNGFRGISIGILSINYALIAYMKLRLMEEYNSVETRKEVSKEYQKIIDDIISEYQKIS